MSLRDLNVTVHPHCTAEFIAGMCHALSDDSGEVVAVIRSSNGRQVVELKREVIDEKMPAFLRRQAI